MHRRTFKQVWKRIVFFFPFQLLVLHLKKNHLLLLVWVLLFAYVTGNLGVKYGIPYLFLFPEYFGRSSFWSFAITGFSFGGFMTAFNLYTYTTHAHRFHFIATVARPFLKFSINNAIIPVLFVLTYLVCSAQVQMSKELVPIGDVTLHLLGFLTGTGLFLLLAYLYFTRTNTDIEKMTGKRAEEYQPERQADFMGPMQPPPPPLKGPARKQASKWLKPENRLKRWHVETYMTQPWKVALARSSDHYDRNLLRSVLWQNHINGSIFEVILVVSFLVLGAFSDLAFFAIPAGASGFVLFTMLLMILSALFSWMKGWTLSVLFGLAILLNAVSQGANFFYDNSAYGLDYTSSPAPYTLDRISELAYDTTAVQRDLGAMESTMGQWKLHVAGLPNAGTKPKMLVVCSSGGGLRAMLWSFRCLQYADSILNGSLMQRTALMTGSSGGLIGSSYFRQLAYIGQQDGAMDLQQQAFLEDMSSDMLNPIAFSFVTNDLFIRYQRVSDGRYSYTKDRGYAFEQRLNELTHGRLDIRMEDMAQAEASAAVPLLVVGPTVINDGRRLLISSSPIAFLTDNAPGSTVHSSPLPETIEFSRFFEDQDAGRMKLTSALRMSSTFPYITPAVTLPSEPPMRVMDAGIRENFGYRTTFELLRDMRGWIAENTSGVVVLQLRDKQKRASAAPGSSSMVSRLLSPAWNVYHNVIDVQDHDYDLALANASSWAEFPIDVIDLQIEDVPDNAISLSWHLTAIEKQQVLSSIKSPANQARFARLRTLTLGVHDTLARTNGVTAPGAMQ
ncbi:MAG: patatin-like phospholipase family protein [Flavobacteriales bacterium]